MRSRFASSVRRVFASLVAMTSGWLVMSVVGGIIWAGMTEGEAGDAVAWALFVGFFGSFVAGAAWLLVYLPVYALVPTRSVFWRWEVCVPVGTFLAVLVFLVGWLLLGGGRDQMGAPFTFMAGVLGGVAAAVGRWLFPWSRHYELELEEANRGVQSS